MTVKKAKFIKELINDIDKDGFSSRQSYTYELNDNGEIIKDNCGKRTVYATKEEVDEMRAAIEMQRKADEDYIAWMAQRKG